MTTAAYIAETVALPVSHSLVRILDRRTRALCREIETGHYWSGNWVMRCARQPEYLGASSSVAARLVAAFDLREAGSAAERLPVFQ